MGLHAQALFGRGNLPGSSRSPLIQSVALKDLEIGRFRSLDSYDALAPNDTQRNGRGDTSFEGSGTGEPTTCTSDIVYQSSASSDDDDDCDVDLDTPMQYAHFHGLVGDYEADDPLTGEMIPKAPGSIYHDLPDPPDLLGMAALQERVTVSLNERLDIDRETAEFLVSTLAASKQEDKELNLQPLLSSGWKPLKLELPVLASDHDIEMRALRRRNTVKINPSGTQPVELDVEKDEGIKFPKAAIADKLHLEQELKSERLDVTKETIQFLQELKSLSVAEYVDYTSEAYNEYKKRRSLHLSPPLLPATPPYSPQPPALEALQVDLTSTPEDLIAKDAMNATEALLRQEREAEEAEATNPPADDLEDAAAIDFYTRVPSSSSPLTRKRLRDLHVEPPLTPRNDGDSTTSNEPSTNAAKRVKFDIDLLHVPSGPDADNADQLLELEHRQDEARLQASFTAAAELVNQKIQEEELAEFDTTLRVKVPQLPEIQPKFCAITSPTDTGAQTGQEELSHGLKCKELVKDLRRWSGVSKIERSLPWAPFPIYLARASLDEQFDDGSLGRYLSEMEIRQDVEEVNVDPYISRRAGHYLSGISDDGDDDEEIEAAAIEDDEDLMQLTDAEPNSAEQQNHSMSIPESALTTILQKRQAQFAERDDSQHQQGVNKAPTPAKRPVLQSSSHYNLIQTGGLAQFMQLQGRAAVLPPTEHQKAKGSNTSAPAVAPQNVAPAAVMVPQPPAIESHSRRLLSIPAPGIRHDKQATIPVVASAGFMSNRQLIRLMKDILPGIDFVERDSTIIGQLQQAHGKREDADISISPSTGVLMTTLQKLKQKPLPGQTSFFGIRDRVAAVSTRYERLFVLVSDGLSTCSDERAMARPLDQLDCDALTDMVGWTCLLDSDVQIIHVAGGGRELANWLAATISHCGVTDGRVCLLQDETMWERWLREAGLNAFAAQAVMARLKDLGNVIHQDDHASMPASLHAQSELSTFITMDRKARIEQFGSLLGGDRVLRRVSEAIDGPWVGRAGSRS